MSLRTSRLIVAVLWNIAGFMILKAGYPSLIDGLHGGVKDIIIMVIWALVALVMFSLFIFPKVYHKNAQHHKKNFDIQGLVKFNQIFTLDTFIIMIVMMTFGVVLRKSGLVPHVFIGGFYYGLGFSLICLGSRFFLPFDHNLNKKRIKNKLDK